MLCIFLLVFVLQQTSGVVHRLTPREYDALPPLLRVDEYARCMRAPGDVYCTVHAQLHGNLSDPLYNLMVEYSADTVTHFNHTQIHWSICPKISCAQHMNSSSNLTVVLEACLNETLGRQYRLRATVRQARCQEYGGGAGWDAGDWGFGAALLALLALAVLGTLCDVCARDGGGAARLLARCSLRRSWRALVEPPSAHPAQRRLRALYAIRTMTTILIIVAHALIPGMIGTNSPQFLEEFYHVVINQVLLNGVVLVQTFFIISGLLASYNMLLLEEKRPLTWQDVPKGMLLRWLRMTPPYAVVLMFVTTWGRHAADGPFVPDALWQSTADCQRYWWWHLLYINNYEDRSQCMMHSWYLAADFQLSAVALLVFCSVRARRHRKMAAAALAAAGTLTTVAHVWLQDLDPMLIMSPEHMITLFAGEPTFPNLLKRGYNNLVGYALGLALGYAVYGLKESDLGSDKFKRYRWLYWLHLPLLLALMAAGVVFYADDVRVPAAARALYAGALKLIFHLLMMLFLFLTVVRVDETLCGFLEWGGWARLSRLAYGVYLVHLPAMRLVAANADELQPAGYYWLMQIVLVHVTMSFLLAVPLFLLVEAPCGALLRAALAPPPPPPRAAPPAPDADADNGGGGGGVSGKDAITVKL